MSLAAFMRGEKTRQNLHQNDFYKRSTSEPWEQGLVAFSRKGISTIDFDRLQGIQLDLLQTSETKTLPA